MRRYGMCQGEPWDAVFEPNLFPYKYPNILKPSHSSYLSAHEDGTDRVFRNVGRIKFRRRGNYPGESIQHSEQDESLKSGIVLLMSILATGVELDVSVND
jgi:hypothetical protein